MKCYNCSDPDKPIVYFEYFREPRQAMALCYICLEYLGFQKEIAAILPKILKCGQCGQKFLPRKSNQTKCSICWGKFFKGEK